MLSYSDTTTALGAVLSSSCDTEFGGSSDYWNIDDILAEEELVPVTFKQPAKGLSHLAQMDTAQLNAKKKIQEEK